MSQVPVPEILRRSRHFQIVRDRADYGSRESCDLSSVEFTSPRNTGAWYELLLRNHATGAIVGDALYAPLSDDVVSAICLASVGRSFLFAYGERGIDDRLAFGRDGEILGHVAEKPGAANGNWRWPFSLLIGKPRCFTVELDGQAWGEFTIAYPVDRMQPPFVMQTRDKGQLLLSVSGAANRDFRFKHGLSDYDVALTSNCSRLSDREKVAYFVVQLLFRLCYLTLGFCD